MQHTAVVLYQPKSVLAQLLPFFVVNARKAANGFFVSIFFSLLHFQFHRVSLLKFCLFYILVNAHVFRDSRSGYIARVVYLHKFTCIYLRTFGSHVHVCSSYIIFASAKCCCLVKPCQYSCFTVNHQYAVNGVIILHFQV